MLIIVIIFSIGCNIEQSPSYKAKQVAAEQVRILLNEPQDTLHNFIKSAKITEENSNYSLVKICDEDVECSCKEAYFVINVSKTDFSSEIIENRPCLFG